MSRALLCFAILAALAARTSASSMNASSEGIRFMLDDKADAMEDAAKKADRHCAEFGNVAVLQSRPAIA